MLRGAHVAFGDGASLEQLVGLLRVPLRGFEIALRRLAIRDGGDAIALLLAILEAGEQLALPDVVALADIDAYEVAFEASAHDSFFDRLEVAGDLYAGLDRPALDGFHVARGQDDRVGPTGAACRARPVFRRAGRVGLGGSCRGGRGGAIAVILGAAGRRDKDGCSKDHGG